MGMITLNQLINEETLALARVFLAKIALYNTILYVVFLIEYNIRVYDTDSIEKIMIKQLFTFTSIVMEA